MTPSTTDLAWAAGIMEGEGSIRINKATKRNLGALILTVTSTDVDMITPLYEWFGGGIRPNFTRTECLDAWRWTTAARQAARALEAIRPYCRRRHFIRKIDHGLAYQAQKVLGRATRTEEYREEQCAREQAAMRHLTVSTVRLVAS